VRHFKIFAVLAVLLLAFSGSALADSVTMTFLGPAGNNSGGVYTYPYLFSINGGAPVGLICDAFTNEVTAGQTWTATVTNLSDAAGMFAGQTQNYLAAGLIFADILDHKIDPNTGNWAIWGLFSTTAANDPYFTSHNIGDVINSYLGLAANATANDVAGLVLYTAVGSAPGQGPQEFIGRVSVPEPTTIVMLLGLGAGVAGLFFFRQRLGLRLVQQA
jgi:hypothetical protein